MAAFSEIHNGEKFARVYVLTASGAIGTTHLSQFYGHRNGVTLCGLGVFHDLVALPDSWSGEAPNQCRSCDRAVRAR